MTVMTLRGVSRTAAHQNGTAPSAGPQVSVESITPDAAAQLVGTMGRNRRSRRPRVEQYARDMKEGRWTLNGATVVIDRDGKLLDGQHRMAAVVEAGVAVNMMVVRGVDTDAMPTIDTGMARTYSDVIGIRGAMHANVAAAIARLWWQYERDAMHLNVPSSHAELDTVRVAHPLIDASASKVAGENLRRLIPPSPLGFVHAYVSEYDVAAADDFLQMVATGAGLAESHPVFALRRRLIDNLSNKAKVQRTEMVALVILAWNATYLQRDVRVLRWRSKGPAAEAFPRIVLG